MGGKLTKFRGHKEITENHESFYPRKFLAVRYLNQILKGVYDTDFKSFTSSTFKQEVTQ